MDLIELGHLENVAIMSDRNDSFHSDGSGLDPEGDRQREMDAFHRY